MKIKIYYDGQCPFCSNYVRLADLRQTADQVDLIDLRDHEEIRSRFSQEGYDLDSGMVVEVDGRTHHGRQAAVVLSRLSERKSSFSKINYYLFKSNFISVPLYGLMRMGRDATLFFMGRSRLGDDSRYAGNLSVFSFFLGVFCFLHFLVYAYQFRLSLYITSYLIPILGIALVLRPENRRVLFISVVVLFVDGILQAPVFSNHTILKNLMVFTFLLAGIHSWVRGGGAAGVYLPFAAVGRGLLLTMYFFGIFHKINQDFLDPTVSCAVALWQDMPPYFPDLQGEGFAYAKAYGTLFIETLIFFFLLSRRFRNAGIAFGIAFHSMLALSGYALYAPFSMLTVVLHVLFISPSHARQILESCSWNRMRQVLGRPGGVMALGGYFLLVWALAYYQQYSAVGLLCIVAMLVPYRAIFTFGRYEDEWSVRDLLVARPFIFNLITLVFIVNCFAPYLGLKTSQSMNMFANLRLEGGQSNHYIMGVPAPFSYLEDLVRVEDPGNDRFLKYIHGEGLWLVYYDFINHMERNRDISVSYFREGVIHDIEGYQDIPEQDRAMLHPRWVRALLHFSPVDLNRPKACALDR